MEGETQSFDPLDISGVVAKAAQAGLLYTVDNYPTFRVSKCKPHQSNPECDAITDELAEQLGVTEEVKNWEWSNQKTGKKTVNKLHKLVDLKLEGEPTEGEDWFINLYIMLHGHPRKNGKIIREKMMPLEDVLDELHIRDSSAGYDPPGNSRGSNKRENTAAAIAQLWQAITGEPLPPFVYAILSKGNEFTPSGKDQRKIFGEPTLQYIILQIVFGAVIYRKRNIFNGSAQNLSLGGNTGLQFVQFLCPEVDWGVEGCLERAKKILEAPNSLAESDKHSWEYTVAFNLKQLVMSELLILTDFEEFMYQPLEAAISSFLCPLVAVTGRRVIAGPDFGPSGSFVTLWINTEVQRAQATSFYNYVIAHNYELPAIDCWRHGEHLQAEARTVDPVKLRIWYITVMLQGDDFLSRNMFGDYYDKWVDMTWGTRTKGKFGNYKEVRFLQRKINWEGKLPMLVYDQERAAVKVCAPRTDKADLASAIKSIALAVGPHPWLPTLKAAYEKCNVDFGMQIDASEGARCGDNIFNMEDMKRYWSPDHNVMRDTGTMRSLAKYGMHVETAERCLLLPATKHPL